MLLPPCSPRGTALPSIPHDIVCGHVDSNALPAWHPRQAPGSIDGGAVYHHPAILAKHSSQAKLKTRCEAATSTKGISSSQAFEKTTLQSLHFKNGRGLRHTSAPHWAGCCAGRDWPACWRTAAAIMHIAGQAGAAGGPAETVPRGFGVAPSRGHRRGVQAELPAP